MKKFIRGIIFTVIVLLVAALIYIWTGAYDISQLSHHSSLTKWLIDQTVTHSIKKRTRNIEVPDLKDNTKFTVGFRHYDGMCVFCHSAPGIEESEFARGLYPDPPGFTKRDNIPGAAEGYWIIKNGIKMTGMPAFATTHSDEEIWSIVAFLVNRLPDMTESDYKSMKKLYTPEPDQDISPGVSSGSHQY